MLKENNSDEIKITNIDHSDEFNEYQPWIWNVIKHSVEDKDKLNPRRYMKLVVVESCPNKMALKGLVNMTIAMAVNKPSKQGLINYVTPMTVKKVAKVVINLNLIDANDIMDLCKAMLANNKKCKFDKSITKSKNNKNAFKFFKAI